MKYKFIGILFLFFLFLPVHSQYDAQKLTRIYTSAGHTKLLSDQLITEKAGSQYLPFNSKLKIRLHHDIVRIDSYLDTIVLNLPEDVNIQKKYLEMNEKWHRMKPYLKQRKLHTRDWKRLIKQNEELSGAIDDFQAAVLLLLSPGEETMQVISRIHEANKEVSRAFFSSIMHKLHQNTRFSTGNETELIKNASKKINKLTSYFKKDNRADYVLTKIKSDLNTFYMGFQNNYDPHVMMSTYIKFNDKIDELYDKIFELSPMF